MSPTGDVDAQISQKTLELWGTTSQTLPEELDPREVWWRDRYEQLKNHGYLLRPRYSPQWVPSWKTSRRDWMDSEDGKRLKVRIFPYRWYLTTCHPSMAKSLMLPGPRMGKWLR